MRSWLCGLLVFAWFLGRGITGAPELDVSAPFAWPPAASEQKPWTYWWWMGSAVDAGNISQLLAMYREAGIGGVHIIPIYGVKGWEDRARPFLGPAWLEALAHTVTEARRLQLGVDMTTGTGWPFGGPQVRPEDAAQRVVLEHFALKAGERAAEPLRGGAVQAVIAVGQDGRTLDLAAHVGSDGALDWTAPEGTWDVFAVLAAPTGQKVKRAAPGGEGYVLDPFSRAACARYLDSFDRAFDAFSGPMPRAQYHDSYEYYGANWTPGLWEAFAARRGYDLQRELPAFFGRGPADRVARVKADYRATVAALLLEDCIEPWVEWSRRRGCLTRNQAHGSPGNILDLYAAADIPETEIFGPSRFPIRGLRSDAAFANEPPDALMLKFASSAAHTGGRRLVAAEACTWLAEHFTVALSQVKPELDQLFVSGINHMVYHGIAYSPVEAPWPGWLFYASTSFAPTNPFWRDFPALNAYAARCQSVLQQGSPACDILLYFPIHDIWHSPDGLLTGLSVHAIAKWLHGSRFHDAAKVLQARGYAFDYISDRLLARAEVEGGAIVLDGARYRVVVMPACRFVSVETAETLLRLARAGATIIAQNGLPEDVPGLGTLEERRARLAGLWRQVPEGTRVAAGVTRAPVEDGAVLRGEDLEALLAAAGVPREPLVDAGLSFIRRTHAGGYHYFVANLSATDAAGWMPLATPARSVVLLDPRRADRAGLASLRKGPDGSTLVYLALASGESCILRTFTTQTIDGPTWRYSVTADDGPVFELGASRTPATGDPAAGHGRTRTTLPVTWRVSFVEGGPTLPASFESDILGSWTDLGGPEARRFAGTARYETQFELPADVPGGWPGVWSLDLGNVGESARIAINGTDLGTLFSLPFTAEVEGILAPGRNEITVEVTNLAANRIADMDRRGEVWRKFHDINFVDIRYRPFDAARWPSLPSGLLGPVRLIPVRAAPHQ